jgi:hypothetical protein
VRVSTVPPLREIATEKQIPRRDAITDSGKLKDRCSQVATIHMYIFPTCRVDLLSNTALRGGLNAEITHHVCIITYRAKTFLCAESGCEKSFVRAEHLARHQLNVGPALEATHSRDTSLTRMKTGQTKYTHVLVVPRSSSARSSINDTNLDEKGMWYRQVRGVVEKSGGASRNRKNPLTPAGPPISPETLISCP